MKYRSRSSHVDARQWLGGRPYGIALIDWVESLTDAHGSYFEQVLPDDGVPFVTERVQFTQGSRVMIVHPSEWVTVDEQSQVLVWSEESLQSAYEPASFCLSRVPHDGYLCYCVMPWEHVHEGLKHVCNHDFSWAPPAEVTA